MTAADPLSPADYRAARNSDPGSPATVTKTWAVFDPYEVALELFATETEAVEFANSRIEGYLGDETWDEDVEGIVVVQIAHVVEQHVIAHRGDDNWDEITSFSADVDVWCDYRMRPVQ